MNKRKDEKTSASIASKAAKILRDKNATPEMKSIAGSVLTQTPNKENLESKKEE